MESKTDEEVEQEQSTITEKKNPILKIIKLMWWIFCKLITIALIFISLIIVTQRVTNNDKSFFGFRLFRVETGSMIPKYEIGDVILVKETEIDKIQKGDDVTYNGTAGSMKGKLVTHQVIDIEEREGKKVFHTKGIANNLEDPVISGEQINGVVLFEIRTLTFICAILTGILRIALTNQYIFYFCAVIPLTIFIFFAFVKNNKRYE